MLAGVGRNGIFRMLGKGSQAGLRFRYDTLCVESYDSPL
jgi:hypothetical protein